VQVVGGSNPLAPTIPLQGFQPGSFAHFLSGTTFDITLRQKLNVLEIS
jgi:hypothetical protein